MIRFLFSTTVIVMSISSYYQIHPLHKLIDIIQAIYTESDEIDECIWRVYLTLTIIFLSLICLLVVEIIRSSLAVFIFNKNLTLKKYENQGVFSD